TPDGAIGDVANTIAAAGAVTAGDTVLHASGATGLDALDAPRAAGARALSLHPLQTCPTVDAALERMAGAGFALSERLARDAGGRPFRLADEAKPLYHAAAVFASNYLVTVTALAHEIER